MSENRVTMSHLLNLVQDEQYHVFPGTTLTVCCVTVANGFTVTGESACADPANFDAEVGRKYAYENAIEKLWALEGYLLRQRLFEAEQLA